MWHEVLKNPETRDTHYEIAVFLFGAIRLHSLKFGNFDGVYAERPLEAVVGAECHIDQIPPWVLCTVLC